MLRESRTSCREGRHERHHASVRCGGFAAELPGFGPRFTAGTSSGPGRNYSTFPSVTLWPLAYHLQYDNQIGTDILYPVFHYQRYGTRPRFAIRPFIYNLEQNPQQDDSPLEVLWRLVASKQDAGVNQSSSTRFTTRSSTQPANATRPGWAASTPPG